MLKRFRTLLIGALLGGGALWGVVSAATAATNDSWLVWNTQDAELLPQSSVIALTQTRDGYLWLGTMRGLVRFDGLHPEVFFEADTIVHLFEDRQGGLWVGTEKPGVRRIQNGTVAKVSFGNGASERLVSAAEDASGAVWLFAADGQLARYRNGQHENTWLINPGAASCRSVVAEPTGEVWIGTDTNLYRVVSDLRSPNFELRLQTIPVTGKQDFLLAHRGGGIWQFANQHIYLRTTNGISQTLGAYPWKSLFTASPVTSACEDESGHLIVGTLGDGVYQLGARGAVTRIGGDQGLNHETVLSLCVDREGNLWVGTDGGGASRLSPPHFQLQPETSGKNVQSVSTDSQGGLWIAFNGGELNYWRDDVMRKYDATTDLPGVNVRAVLVDARDTVWLGGIVAGGIYQFMDGRFRIAPGTEGVRPQVSVLFQDRATNIWVGALEGLAFWNGATWRLFTTQDGLTTNSVRALAEDAHGDLWIGTDGGGLNRLHEGKFTGYRAAETGLPSDYITALHADATGAVWVGTSGGGLTRYQNHDWKHFGKSDGLAGNNITYLAEDDSGFLWIGSNEGLMRVAKSTLNAFADGHTNRLHLRTFGKADGLPTKECSSGSQPSVGRGRTGRMWFPTTKGLVSLQPTALRPNTNPPPVVIESVLVDGKAQSTNAWQTTWPREVIVPARKEVVEIHFTSLNLTAPEQAQFQYRLDDGDARWIDSRGSREVRFTRLPPGRYHFQVRASNEDGFWSPLPATLHLVVIPPFWQRWWFQAAVVVGLIGVIGGVVYFISTQKLQRQLALLRQQEALEKERARIARDLHDQLGANLTQVNLLGEMVGEDKDLPEEVATHAEQICKTARQTSDALDEIVWAANPSNDTLEGLVNYACKYAQEYLALANLRYRLDVPPTLPALNIPPDLRHNVFLAFKESVNNVVKHARATEVKIHLRLMDDQFVFEIEDNGRGPAEAATKTGRNGLRNMRKRMEDVAGSFHMIPGPERGTIVRLTAPLTRH